MHVCLYVKEEDECLLFQYSITEYFGLHVFVSKYFISLQCGSYLNIRCNLGVWLILNNVSSSGSRESAADSN